MGSAAPATTPTPKWWKWQPVTGPETAIYLGVLAPISGVISVLLNLVFAGEADWGATLSSAA